MPNQKVLLCNNSNEDSNMINYQYKSMVNNENEHEDNTGVMIHVVPENKGSWTHIKDLDSFFKKMYYYYVQGGFLSMVVSEFFLLGRYCFIILFLTFLMNCVNYPVLFRQDLSNPSVKNGNVTFADIVYPQCVQRISFNWWILLITCSAIGSIRLIKSFYNLYHAYEMKSFYNNALGIKDSDLCWISWYTVLGRVRNAQVELQMCIHKQQITELDIYQRILRFNNYFVAMVNKDILPLYISIPYVGEIPYLSKGLKFNLDFILFHGPWSPWENCWHLKDCYKDASKRKHLAKKLESHIKLLALINLLLAPFIQTWQILYFFFSYAELIKRSPGLLGLRMWSLYARTSLRHYNELDHELCDRLYRAYKPVSKYLSTFPAPITTILAKNITFVSASILGVLLVLSIYNEIVLTVVHMITVITILGIIVAGARACVPEEGTSQLSSEELLVQILGHIHYLPSNFRGKAHTKLVTTHFQRLFLYKAIYLIMELISPIICPFVLFSLRTRALDIVDFYRNFTLTVLGIGDVCSFAQMDIHRHGNPDWNVEPSDVESPTTIPQYNQGEDGKVELSLIAFSCRNPGWRANNHSQKRFLNKIRHGVVNATNNYLSGNCNFNMNRTMLNSYYNQNFNHGQLGFPTENSHVSHTINSVINEEENEEEERCSKRNEIIPDKVESSQTEVYDLSISTLHLYDLHIAKMASRTTSRSIGTTESTFRSHPPSTSGYIKRPELSLNSNEDTPLLRKHIP